MKKRWHLGLAVLLLGVSLSAQARDDFPSCYKLIGQQPATQAQRELAIIVDQTTPLDVDMKRSIHRKVHGFLRPGDSITILTFSAFVKERYDKIVLRGTLDPSLNEDARFNTSKPKLRRFDACMEKEKAFVYSEIDAKLKDALMNATRNLPRSDIAGALAEFGRTIITESNAQRVVVLIVSDMIQNSDIVTFYNYERGWGLEINKHLAIQRIQKAGLVSDWQGADVYVVGAGLVPGKGYRSHSTLNKLRQFWEAYFKLSNANILGWGQPYLMSDIK